MPKSSSKVPSHASQITFKNKDDVYHVNDPPSPSSRSNTKTSKTSSKGSKSSLKGSKSSTKQDSPSKTSRESTKSKSDKSIHSPPATSTPKSSKHKPPPEDLDVSAIEPPKQILQAETGDYVPMPYIFRTTNTPRMKEVKQIPTKCPPYYLQLDHALAVIWLLYSKTEVKRPLGIVQLQWALNFLQGIYNRKGEHPKDVALCIQQIEDHLIEQYADMVDDVQYIKKPTDSADKPKGKDKDKKSKSKARGSRSESEVPDVEHEEVEIAGTDGKGQAEGADPGKGTEGETGGEGCIDDTCQNKLCTEADRDDTLVMKQVPFSINYAEMMSRSPPDVEELYPCCKSSKTSSIGSTSRRSTSVMGTSVSRDNMLEFLKTWRREQVEKIQAELKRLKSIENFIGSAETENFSPYLDEKQLDALVAQKMNSSKPKSKDKTKQ